MDDDLIGLLGAFASAPSLAEKWDAARRIMLDKRRGKAADHPLLLEGLGTLRAWADPPLNCRKSSTIFPRRSCQLMKEGVNWSGRK